MNLQFQKILEHNYGFKEIDKWLSYAEKKNFKYVSYKAVNCCPDCGVSSFNKIGQFVYYSTLHSLLECTKCKLWYVDVLIDDGVRAAHFEAAYKSESYFKELRKDIFSQTIDLVSSKDISKNLILELGGATGELSLLLKNRFPSAKIILNDISIEACETAKSKALDIICGSISKIDKFEQCSTVIALDVLYYEPEIKKSFENIYSFIEPGGILILRLPNKYILLKLASLFNKSNRQNKITFFNPEHIYVFTRRYLENKLNSVGFSCIEFYPSALLRRNNVMVKLFYLLAVSFFKYTGIIITPSFFVVAKKI